MASRKVKPVVTNVRMSDYGYWVVDVSVASGKVCSVMVAVTGISSQEAPQHALETLTAQVRGISS